jgi:hypothetical protein
VPHLPNMFNLNRLREVMIGLGIVWIKLSKSNVNNDMCRMINF